MSFLFRSLTATFCFSWYAHIVAILHRKTYLIQPVIQLSKFNRAPQGVVSGIRGEYPTNKKHFSLVCTERRWYSTPFVSFLLSLLIADFFEEMDKLFFLFRSEMACYQGFVPSLIPTGVRVCTPPFSKRIFQLKTKNSRKPFIYGIFRLKKYFEIF